MKVLFVLIGSNVTEKVYIHRKTIYNTEGLAMFSPVATFLLFLAVKIGLDHHQFSRVRSL